MTHMKTFVTLATVLMVVALGTGVSRAVVPDRAKSKAAQTRQKEYTIVQTIDGKVSAVKPGTKTVEVTVPWGKADCLIPGASVTEIKEGKTSKNLADLKTGERVEMKFIEHVRARHSAKPIVIPLEQHRS